VSSYQIRSISISKGFVFLVFLLCFVLQSWRSKKKCGHTCQQLPYVQTRLDEPPPSRHRTEKPSETISDVQSFLLGSSSAVSYKIFFGNLFDLPQPLYANFLDILDFADEFAWKWMEMDHGAPSKEARRGRRR
jgi:hypothetical protein